MGVPSSNGHDKKGSPEAAKVERRLWSVKDFCRAHSIGQTTLFAMISKGEIESVKVRGRRLIPDSASAKLTGKIAA